MLTNTKFLKAAIRGYKENSSDENYSYDKFLGLYRKEKEPARDKKRTAARRLHHGWVIDDLAEKSILVIGENGVGDEVLTVACLPQLIGKCKHILWLCNPKLQRLFSRSFPDAEFITKDDVQPAIDAVVYSWELIDRFRGSLNDFNWIKDEKFYPYLKAHDVLRDNIKQRYADSDGTRPIVGLAWRSEREGETISGKTCDLRDVPQWKGFFDALKDKVRFVSLQYGDTQTDIDFVRWKYGVEIYQDQCLNIYDDIDAAAAQIAAVDYVVSNSMTAAHLAGALGVPGWLMLSNNPFLHWLAGKNICPWYPTLRPLRQKKAGDWQSVIESVTTKLCQEVSRG